MSAKCLRCGAGPEWLQGHIPNEMWDRLSKNIKLKASKSKRPTKQKSKKVRKGFKR